MASGDELKDDTMPPPSLGAKPSLGAVLLDAAEASQEWLKGGVDVHKLPRRGEKREIKLVLDLAVGGLTWEGKRGEMRALGLETLREVTVGDSGKFPHKTFYEHAERWAVSETSGDRLLAVTLAGTLDARETLCLETQTPEDAVELAKALTSLRPTGSTSVLEF